MKLSIAALFLAFAFTPTLRAESLTLLKWDIENDIRVLEGAQKLVIGACEDLEKNIPEYNRRNDALNAELPSKRAAKRVHDEQLAVFQASVDQLRMAYNSLLGTIAAKKVQLVAQRVNYVAELIRARDAARVELIMVSAEKRALERKLRDLDNFPDEAAYLEALKKFYELKDREANLVSYIFELEALIRNPVTPEEKALRAEIAALEAKAVSDFRVLAGKTAELGAMIVANKKLGIEIAILEAKLKVTKNFVVPSVCTKF